MHNLTFMARLMGRLRAAIAADRYAEESAAILG
jgi:queuine/archaeosine tRNA-ribosyltransferase